MKSVPNSIDMSERLERKVNALSDELDVAWNTIRTLEESLQKSNDEAVGVRSELDLLKSKYHVVTESFEFEKERADTLQAQYDESVRRNAECQNCDKLLSELEDAKAIVSNSRNRAAEAESRCSELERQSNVMLETITAMTQRLHQLQDGESSQAYIHSNVNERLQEELDDSRIAISRMLVEREHLEKVCVGSLHRATEALVKGVAACSEKMLTQGVSRSVEASTAIAEREELRGRVYSLEGEKDMMRKKLDSLSVFYQDLQTEIEFSTRDRTELQAQYDLLKRETDKLEAKYVALKTTLQEMSLENQRSAEENRRLTAERNRALECSQLSTDELLVALREAQASAQRADSAEVAFSRQIFDLAKSRAALEPEKARHMLESGQMGIAADMGDPASSSGDRGSKYVSGSEVSASRAGNVGGTSDLHQALGIERERAAKWETLAKSLERKVVALEIDLMRFAQKKPLNVLPQENSGTVRDANSEVVRDVVAEIARELNFEISQSNVVEAMEIQGLITALDCLSKSAFSILSNRHMRILDDEDMECTDPKESKDWSDMSAKMLWRKMFGIDSDAKSPRQRGVPSRSDHEVRARACDQRIVERLKQVSDRWGVAEGGRLFEEVLVVARECGREALLDNWARMEGRTARVTALRTAILDVASAIRSSLAVRSQAVLSPFFDPYKTTAIAVSPPTEPSPIPKVASVASSAHKTPSAVSSSKSSSKQIITLPLRGVVSPKANGLGSSVAPRTTAFTPQELVSRALRFQEDVTRSKGKALSSEDKRESKSDEVGRVGERYLAHQVRLLEERNSLLERALVVRDVAQGSSKISQVKSPQRDDHSFNYQPNAAVIEYESEGDTNVKKLLAEIEARQHGAQLSLVEILREDYKSLEERSALQVSALEKMVEEMRREWAEKEREHNKEREYLQSVAMSATATARRTSGGKLSGLQWNTPSPNSSGSKSHWPRSSAK